MIKVLVVEDDPMVAQFHEHYLSQVKGFELAGKAKNGVEALELLEKFPIQLIILDIFMPIMDGLEFLKKIRSLNKDVDVIIVSANQDAHHIHQTLRCGVIDYIIKPFSFERLNLTLTNFSQRHFILKNNLTLDQLTLDKQILYKNSDIELSIPKGLDRNTLKDIWEAACLVEGTFTTEEMAKKINISRVSVRKYLNFLKNLHILSLELHRGAVGRPVYKYTCINKNQSLIDPFI